MAVVSFGPPSNYAHSSLLALIRAGVVLLASIMSSVPCVKCGAEIAPGTRFCRRCGQPALDVSSVSEATTRVLRPTAERDASTQHWNAQPTGPAYIAPNEQSSPQAPATKGLERAGRRSKAWLISLLIVIPLVALLALTIFVLKSRNTLPIRPVVSVPGAPPHPPNIPGHPPPGGATSANSELIYPGAEITMNLNRGAEESILQLRTSDPFEKVVDWYAGRLKAAEVVRIPGQNTILQKDGTHVVITATGEGTSILVGRGLEK